MSGAAYRWSMVGVGEPMVKSELELLTPKENEVVVGVADAVTTPSQAVVQAEVGPGEVVIVIGIGGVGGYAVQIARAFGATVIAIDVDQTKLDKMAEYGASLTINSRNVLGRELKKTIQSFVKEQGLPATCWKILECSGSAPGQETAYGLLTWTN